MLLTTGIIPVTDENLLPISFPFRPSTDQNQAEPAGCSLLVLNRLDGQGAEVAGFFGSRPP
jgi:hypothetical protein